MNKTIGDLFLWEVLYRRLYLKKFLGLYETYLNESFSNRVNVRLKHYDPISIGDRRKLSTELKYMVERVSEYLRFAGIEEIPNLKNLTNYGFKHPAEKMKVLEIVEGLQRGIGCYRGFVRVAESIFNIIWPITWLRRLLIPLSPIKPFWAVIATLVGFLSSLVTLWYARLLLYQDFIEPLIGAIG